MMQMQRIEPAAGIPIVRRVKPDFASTPLHWFDGDPVVTHFWNVLHLLLPAGERWFVRVYKEALAAIDDDHLKQRVRAFLGQEGMHAGAHDVALELLARHGIDAQPFVRYVELAFENLLASDTAPRSLRSGWLAMRLALVAAIEHFTSVGGQWFLDAKVDERAAVDKGMHDLILWHAAEEVEHRSVAFDAFEHVSGRRALRRAAMLVLAPTFVEIWVEGWRFLLNTDPTLGRSYSRLDVSRAWRRDAKRGLIPSPREVFGWVPRYLAASFHPEQEGSLEHALAVLGRSPIVVGAR